MLVRGKGIIVLLQRLWERQGLVQREGQARQGRLKRVCPKFRTDAKPKKHTQTLALRKVGGIVRFWKGWVQGEGWRYISLCGV